MNFIFKNMPTFRVALIFAFLLSSCQSTSPLQSVRKKEHTSQTSLPTLKPPSPDLNLTPSNTFEDQPPEVLVIGLDGIPFTTFRKMKDGGYFPDFAEPGKMIATFPSISDPNWARLMRTTIGSGYTKAYFNPFIQHGQSLGEVQGNLLDHLKTSTSYERAFDFKVDGFFEHLATVAWMKTSGLYWLDSLEKTFWTTRKRKTFFAFIMNTDFLSHTEGEISLMSYLADLDLRIRKIRVQYKNNYHRDLEVILVSDHGNEFTSVKKIELEETLSKLNWKQKDAISDLKDYVYVAPEILSFGALYSKKGQELALAKDLSTTPGVHLTAAAKDEHVLWLYSKGKLSGKIHVQPTALKVLYEPVGEIDPLQQKDIFKGKYLNFNDYFKGTLDHAYPYSAVRIWEAFYKNSQIPSSVVASTESGWAFSNPTLDFLTKLRGLKSLHGSLRQQESAGIIVSTKRDFVAIRPDDFGHGVVPLDELKPLPPATQNQ